MIRRLIDWCLPTDTLRLGPLTVGGMFDATGMPRAKPAPRRGDVIVASGGLVAIMPPRWDQWRRWSPPPTRRLADFVPAVRTDRGGIRFVVPPPRP